MNTKDFYYSVPGGEVAGPLPLETIHAAMNAGRLSGNLIVSPDGQTEWMPIKLAGRGAIPKKAAAPAKKERSGSVAGFIEIIGYLNFAAGVLFIAMFFMYGTAILAYLWAVYAVSAFVTGCLFLAVAEALGRLRVIAENSRK